MSEGIGSEDVTEEQAQWYREGYKAALVGLGRSIHGILVDIAEEEEPKEPSPPAKPTLVQ